MTWQLTVTGGARLASPMGAEPIIVEGDGPMPRLKDLNPPDDPVDDGRPFIWPIQPWLHNTDSAHRASWRWDDPRRGHPYYTQLPEFENPLPHSHAYAGMTPLTDSGPLPGGHR